ncbi:MAG: AtpZ/AtpI family protein [Kofleriaceae bacterium]|nr:MAG: AtpZ/AtpI family protein [Kofleriaceae bacterium]
MAHPVHSDGMSQVQAPAPSRAAVRAAAPYAVKTKGYYQTLSATSVGIEMAVAVVIGLFFGMWLDRQLGIAPAMMITWLLIGFAAGLRAVFRHVAASDRLAAESQETETPELK